MLSGGSNNEGKKPIGATVLSVLDHELDSLAVPWFLTRVDLLRWDGCSLRKAPPLMKAS